MKILVSNHHTSYTYLLALVLDGFDVFGNWDFDQRPFPNNTCAIDGNDLDASSYDLFISNNALLDIRLITLRMFWRVPTLIVIHGELARGCETSLLRKYIKLVFYKALNFSKNNTLICIQESVKESFGLKSAEVITPGIAGDKFVRENKNNKILLVGNNIMRAQFCKKTLRALDQSDLDFTIVGRNNSSAHTVLPSTNFLETNNYHEFQSTLSKFQYILNVLLPPEAPYNLGVLEGVKSGLIPLQLIRKDQLFDSSNSIIFEGMDDLFRSLKNPKTASLRVNSEAFVEKHFCIANFKEKWRAVIEKSMDY